MQGQNINPADASQLIINLSTLNEQLKGDNEKLRKENEQLKSQILFTETQLDVIFTDIQHIIDRVSLDEGALGIRTKINQMILIHKANNGLTYTAVPHSNTKISYPQFTDEELEVILSQLKWILENLALVKDSQIEIHDIYQKILKYRVDNAATPLPNNINWIETPIGAFDGTKYVIGADPYKQDEAGHFDGSANIVDSHTFIEPPFDKVGVKATTPPLISMDKKYETVSGKPTRVICIDTKYDDKPVIALVDMGPHELMVRYNKYGQESNMGVEIENDLVEVVEKKKVKVEVEIMGSGYVVVKQCVPTDGGTDVIVARKTIEIDFFEGEGL